MNKAPLNIAFVGTKGVPAKWGGIETYVESVGRRLAERGHRITVYASKWYCADYLQDTYRGIHIRRIPTLRTQATDALTNAYFAACSIVKTGYEIAHFHGLASYYFIPKVTKAGILTVITTHAMASNWENMKYNFLGRWVIRQAFLRGIKSAHCATTVARHLQEEMKAEYGVEADLCPAGIEAADRRPPEIITEKYRLKGSDYLLFLGRIDPIKRVEWTLELASLLSDRLRLVIAGGAQDPTTAAYLQDLRRKAGDHPDIIFTGPVVGREKAELFSNCLAFLAPSVDEGLPLTLLEAAAYKKACIASDIAAFRAVIRDGKTGYLFPKKDKTAFKNKVAAAVQNPETLKRLGYSASKQLMAHCNWDRTTDRLESLYYRLCEGANRCNSAA